MKRILLTLLALAILLLPILPLAKDKAAAATTTTVTISGPADCCKLRRAVPEISKCKTQGTWVGPENPVACPTNETVKVVSEWGMCCLLSSVRYITDWIFLFLIVVTVVMLVIGGFMMVTAMGDTEKLTTGRNYIMLAVVGLAVALVARAVPFIVKTMLGL